MRFLCDVHISLRISKRIEELGFVSQHVNHILDRWHTRDNLIAEFADTNDLILITKDQDFRNSFLVSGKPKKLIKVNLGNVSNADLTAIIEENIEKLKNINDENTKFMVEINKDGLLILTR